VEPPSAVLPPPSDWLGPESVPADAPEEAPAFTDALFEIPFWANNSLLCGPEQPKALAIAAAMGKARAKAKRRTVMTDSTISSSNRPPSGAALSSSPYKKET
jgi:hypothetical protein